jgi:rRNA maturation RNase YbeY
MKLWVRSALRCVRFRSHALQQVVHRILEEAGAPGAELGLLFIGDRRMRRLNRLYRGRDYPTDVLAFPMTLTHPAPLRGGGLGRGGPRAPSPAPDLLGDVVISLHRAASQARQAGHPLDREALQLLVHGILHLLGYDHERGEREARRMRRKELAILRSLTPLPKLFKADRDSALARN